MSKLKITLIVAATENNVIGKGNKMPWHLPNDLKYFKKNTLEHSVVMGRKTFESLGKPLPDRRNIILTRDMIAKSDEVDIANSFQEVLNYCRDEREIFIIGGGEIFKQTLPFADKVLLTRLQTTIEGDAYFPDLPAQEWELESEEKHVKDEKHAFDYSFQVYVRK
ncbi:dihydrofolate reductase [Sphingobacterium faecium NBRC 15299]|uniref:dihydrofolate reductase n=1 Tax=Sphingobacterium faecium TaxID=34087 RepID=UPI000D33823E|nr:dihydrofolate reductase [Sphingobacterium faecium]PTX09026.1 dihydrofolate reductase [Sphingobacterium faecium]GEM65022.1 dihydrofolate reductase [Sphingobacterium faecium NBRC 15299]